MNNNDHKLNEAIQKAQLVYETHMIDRKEAKKEMQALKAELSVLRVSMSKNVEREMRIDLYHLIARLLIGCFDIAIMATIAIIVYQIHLNG